jgi:hypothetical protein
LLGAVWVGNPKGLIPMSGYPSGCYRALGTTLCSNMYGSMAPGHTWQMTFERALQGLPVRNFVPVPPSSALFSLGNGQSVRKPPAPPPHHHHGGGGNGGGGGHH